MDLCAASWEVIRMTSRTIRGLVPDLSGDGGRISSSAHFASSHCHPSPTGEATHQWRRGPFGMHGHGQGHDLLYVCMYVRMHICMLLLTVCVCVCGCYFSPADKERQGDDQLSLIPEESSISAARPDDPGGSWLLPLWLHPVTVEAAPTPPRLVGLIRRPVRLAGRRLWRPCRSALLSTAVGVGVFCQRPCLTVCVTTAGAFLGSVCCVTLDKRGWKLLSRSCWLFEGKAALGVFKMAAWPVNVASWVWGERGSRLSQPPRQKNDQSKKGGRSKLFRLQSKRIKRAKVWKSGLTALLFVRLAKGGSTHNF